GRRAQNRGGEGAVVRPQPVVGTEGRGRGDLDALMAAARADERRPALLDEDVHPVVERFGHAHPAMELEVFLASCLVALGGGRHQFFKALAMSTTSSAVSPSLLR